MREKVWVSGDGPPALAKVPFRRRASERRPFSARLAVLRETGDVLAGWAINASRGGLRILALGGLASGERVAITLDAGEQRLVERGRVVWVLEKEDGVVAGIELLHTSGIHRTVAPSSMR